MADCDAGDGSGDTDARPNGVLNVPARRRIARGGQHGDETVSEG
jgi:hypothetical protein